MRRDMSPISDTDCRSQADTTISANFYKLHHESRADLHVLSIPKLNPASPPPRTRKSKTLKAKPVITLQLNVRV